MAKLRSKIKFKVTVKKYPSIHSEKYVKKRNNSTFVLQKYKNTVIIIRKLFGIYDTMHSTVS